jgi:hypothetical protein
MASQYVAFDELAATAAPLVEVAHEPGHENGAAQTGPRRPLLSSLRAALADTGSSKQPMVDLEGI